MQDPNEKVTSNLQPDRQLNFRVRDIDVVVNLSDVASLFSDMESYNRQFSAGVMLARMLMSQIEANGADENGKNEQLSQTIPTLVEEGSNQQVNAFFLVSKHKQLGDSIGLSLEPTSGKSQAIFSEDGQVGIGEMRVNVTDQEHFTSFLEVLTPEQLTNASLRSGFESVARLLTKQILDKYDLNMPEDEAIQLFMGMEKIIAEYQRLGMDKAVQQLGVYLEHGRIGDLREFVSCEEKNLFAEPGKSFGPGDWHKDSSPDLLEGRWNGAINALELAYGNPRAKALAEQLHSHLLKCANAALMNMPTLKNWNEEDMKIYSTIVEVAIQKLEMMLAEKG